ncbi:MAG: extracellular solute-binding protein [Anaerolineae bacterium]|nr:extracellular solute-binding protein [Anaerolineae bacterium]
MDKRMQVLLAVLMLAVLALAPAACAKPAPTATPPPPTPRPAEQPTAAPEPTAVPVPAREPQELTMWVYMTDADLAALNEVLAGWKEETGDTVTVVNYPYFDLLNKVEVAFPAGEGPDVCEIPHTNTGVWSEAGLIAPIDEAMGAEDRASYHESALQGFTFGGRLYGVPLIADTVVLMYNRALIPEPPDTMEELIEVAKGLTQEGQYGFLLLDNNMWFGWLFVGGYGGYIFGAGPAGFDPEDMGVANEGAIQGMEYMLKLRNEHKLIPTDLDWNLLTGKFTEGKVGAIVMNANQYSVYKQAGVDVGMAVLPELPNGEMPQPLLTVHGFAVNAYSQKKQAAAELAAYLGAHLPVPLFKAGVGNVPVRVDVLEDPAFAQDPDAMAAVQQVGYAQPVPGIAEMAQVWVPVNSAFELAAKGDKTPAQALKEAEEAVRTAIAGQE